MATKIDRSLSFDEKRLSRAIQMPNGRGWRLVTPRGMKHKAALLKTFSVNGERLAVFHIVKKVS